MSLRRSHFRDLSLSKSSADIVRSKVKSVIVQSTSRSRPDQIPVAAQRHSCPPRLSIPRRNRRPHPIHNIPNELLSHIFILASLLPGTDYTSPLIVSHVCGAWRDVALGTPALWRRLSFDGVKNGAWGYERGCRFEMWRERVLRAKACSLDIELGVPPVCDKPPHFDIHTVQYYIHFIQPTLSRWRSLHIAFASYAPYLWNAALSPLSHARPSSYTHAPLLEDLTLIYPANDDSKQFTLFGGHTPRLQSLTLDGIRLAWLPGLMANLTFLDYTHRGRGVGVRGMQAVALVLEMLEVSGRVEELRLTFPSEGEGGMPGHAKVFKKVALPFLVTLHLRVDGSDVPHEMYNLLPNLALPSLTTLHLIDVSPPSRVQPFPHLGPFLRVFRIPLSVRYLLMESRWVDHRTLPGLFHYLKGLKRAVILGAKVPDPYFAGYEVRRRGGGLVVMK